MKIFLSRLLLACVLVPFIALAWFSLAYNEKKQINKPKSFDDVLAMVEADKCNPRFTIRDGCDEPKPVILEPKPKKQKPMTSAEKRIALEQLFTQN